MSSSANTFNINPCSACRKNYDITDINDINQCCYDTLGAFEGANSLNAFRNSPEAQNCRQCVLDSMQSIGRDPCNLRLTAYPSWIQAPHYFPGLLTQEGNVETAKDKCLELCQSNRYAGECANNCKIDSDAVETFENYTQKKSLYKSGDITQEIMSSPYLLVVAGFIVGLIVFFIINLLCGKKTSSRV